MTVLGGTGAIWVHTEPGVIVYLDGVQVGIANQEQNGLIIPTVQMGQHQLRFELPGQGSSAAEVLVEKNQTAQVDISSMVLRNSGARKGGLEVRLKSNDTGCQVKVADGQKPIVEGTAGFYDLMPNTYPVAVTCAGNRTVGGNVTVAPGRIALIDVNPLMRQFNLMGDRPRTTHQVTVYSSRDKLDSAPIPAEAKRVIIGALPDGASVVDIKMYTGGIIHLTVVSKDSYSMSKFVYKLRDAEVFDQIAIGKTAKDGPDRWRFDVAMLYTGD